MFPFISKRNKSERKSFSPLTLRQKIGLIGFSLVLILIAELVLRLFGFGGHPSLFVPVMRDGQGNVTYISNPAVQLVFFMARKKNQPRQAGGLLISLINKVKHLSTSF